MPTILRYLRTYQKETNGEYPYLACTPVWGLVIPDLPRAIYKNVDKSGSELHKARMVFHHQGSMSVSGPYYSFNVTALHDIMRIVETCPINVPGDNQQAAFFHCMGRDPSQTSTKRGYDWWFKKDMMAYYAPPPEWIDANHTIEEMYHPPVAPAKDSTLEITHYHHLKHPHYLSAVYNNYYAKFWGTPRIDESQPAPSRQPGCKAADYRVIRWQWNAPPV